MSSKYRIPIYTLKSTDHYYHVTGNPSYKFDAGFRHDCQEFGAGLYATPSQGVRFWTGVLSLDTGKRKQYIVQIYTAGLKVIKEDDMPSRHTMEADLKKAGVTASDVLKSEKLLGDTLGRNRMDVVIKRRWAKLQGADGIIPIPRKEEPQLILFNPDVKYGSPKRISDFFRDRKML